MGNNQETHRVTVCATTSNHNSPRDDRDRAIWKAAIAEISFAIQQLNLEDRYKVINLNIIEGLDNG